MDDAKYISESDISEFLYSRLIEMGYLPAADEILDIAELVIDFLFENSMIIDCTEGEDA